MERKRVEELFRTNAVTVLVATSAFGEGVNIPNIRHVVLYHLPFNEIEFNQMAGRAGRDGTPAVIHLLYGRQDAQLNERILAQNAPDHDTLAMVYRRLRQMQREAQGASLRLTDADLAQLGAVGSDPTGTATAACGSAAPVTVRDRACIEKSYPCFWTDLSALKTVPAAEKTELE